MVEREIWELELGKIIKKTYKLFKIWRQKKLKGEEIPEEMQEEWVKLVKKIVVTIPQSYKELLCLTVPRFIICWYLIYYSPRSSNSCYRSVPYNTTVEQYQNMFDTFRRGKYYI